VRDDAPHILSTVTERERFRRLPGNPVPDGRPVDRSRPIKDDFTGPSEILALVRYSQPCAIAALSSSAKALCR